LFLITFTSIIIIRYPLALILIKYTSLKETGIWIAILTSSFVALLLNYLYYKSNRWRKKAILPIME
jgi:Na+-driven multidrug efflux pump